VDEHGLRLPDSFVAYVVRKSDEMDADTVDEAWWNEGRPSW
jgi:hypothetical protein